MMFGLAMMSKPIILLLLGDEWAQVIPFMQISCVIYAFWPIHAISLQAIQAMGHSNIFLRLEIYKKTLLLLVLFGTFQHSVLMIALGRLIITPLTIVINIRPNIKLIGYSFKDLFCDLYKSIIVSIVFIIVGGVLLILDIPTIYLLIIQILAFSICYLLLLYLLCPNLFIYFKSNLMNKLKVTR